VIVAMTLLVTLEVETVNVPEEAPGEMLRLLGVIAAGALLDRVTTAPPEGVALGSVTVQALENPAVTDAGLHASDSVAAGDTVIAVAAPTPLLVALMMTVWPVLVVKPVALNVALLAPAGIVKLAGKESKAPLATELRETTNPPLGAGPERATVQTVCCPATMEVGEQAMAETAGPGGLPLVPLPVPAPPEPVIVAPFPETLRAPPALSEAMAVTATAVVGAPPAMVNVTDATAPLRMMFVLVPAATQVSAPATGSW